MANRRVVVVTGPLDIGQCEFFARRIEVVLRHGNWDEARSIIDEAESAAGAAQDPLTLATPICDMLSPRTVEVLEHRGIFTAGDVLALSEETMRGFRLLGPMALREIRDFSDKIRDAVGPVGNVRQKLF